MPSHLLTLVCPDRLGIVASVAEGLLTVEANIAENAQFRDLPTAMFCMPTRFDSPVDAAAEVAAALRRRADACTPSCGAAGGPARPGRGAGVTLRLLPRRPALPRARRRAAARHPSRSNHRDVEATVTAYGIAFEHVPVTDATRAAAEDRIRALVAAHDIELVVLARYLQIVSDACARSWPGG